MSSTTDYTSLDRKKMVGTREITVRNWIPVFKSQEEREIAGQKIQDGLYKVFQKYMVEQAG